MSLLAVTAVQEGFPMELAVPNTEAWDSQTTQRPALHVDEVTKRIASNQGG